MIQIMQFDFESHTLRMFVDTFTMAQFESVATKYAYAINGKNWIETENRYDEGLIICDTNDENVLSKKIIAMN
jgi:hypothetical protein